MLPLVKHMPKSKKFLLQWSKNSNEKWRLDFWFLVWHIRSSEAITPLQQVKF